MENIRNKIENIKTILNENLFINFAMTIEFESAERISMHLSDIHRLGISEKLYLLRDGMKRIAEYLKTDPKFKNIKIISATSWIVTVKPKLMESLGFTIDNESPESKKAKIIYKGRQKEGIVPEEMKDVEPTYSYISKDKLIEMYGNI